MKRYIVFLLIFFAGVGIGVFGKQTKKGAQIIGSDGQEESRDKNVKFNFENQDLIVVYQKIEKGENLTLIPNFEKKEIAKDVYDREKCKLLTNAGFYSLDNKPIGLFIADGVPLSNLQNNLLFDGVFSVNFMGIPRITRSIPRDPLKLALQSGPILKENNEFKNLSIIDDHPARRIVMGVTGENKAVLMVIYKDGSSFDGPLLGNLPTVLKTFEEKSETTLPDPINLDGGGASAFYSGDTILTEASPVGSFFCQHE